MNLIQTRASTITNSKNWLLAASHITAGARREVIGPCVRHPDAGILSQARGLDLTIMEMHNMLKQHILDYRQAHYLGAGVGNPS